MTRYDCMTPAELALWMEQANLYRKRMGEGTHRPCTDCPLAFRLVEIEAGRCCKAPSIRQPSRTMTAEERRESHRRRNREWMRSHRRRQAEAA